MLTVGCAKRDAQKAQTLAQAAKDDAVASAARGYAPKAFNDADSLMQQAQAQFDAGSYKESIDLYQQATSRFGNAKNVAVEVKPRVDALVSKIEEALALATENLEKGRTGGALTAEDLDPVQAVVDDLNQRLESEIRNEVDEEKLNAFLAEVESGVTRTESLALAHLKPQAAAEKQAIQDLIARAQELKADVHVPAQFNEVLQKFQAVETAEKAGQWQQVIDSAGELKAPLDRIVLAAQEKAAGDILRQTGERIAQAKQLNVQGVDAFASAVQRAEAAVQTGQTALQSQNYAGAIGATDQAKAALQEAYQAVGQQAQQKIETAKANLQNAVEQEAEKYAAQVVAQVKESIASAEQLLGAENFVQAYNASQQAEKVSGQAVDAARRGKAQIAISAVEKPFSVLHGQGGSEYASDAYKQALAKVQDLRSKMKGGEYETVVSESPAAVTVVQDALQVLEKSTSEYVEQADAALGDAKTSGAPEWVGVQFANATNLRSAAEKDRQAKKYLSSIRNSESAIKAAQDAESKAYQLQTEQNLRKADDFLALAKRAEQDRLSPLAYRKALESREESVRLIKQGNSKEAFANSKDTVQKSDRALNNLVMTAKEKSDSALTAEAMKYSEPEIKEALAYLNKAEEAQKARNFSTANEMAIESAKLSDKAEYFTWKQRSYRLLRDLEGTKEELEYNLAPEKAPALYEQVLSSLAEAQVQQLDRNYAESYQYADKADRAKNAIWNAMEQELTQVVAEIKQTADWMGENAMDADGRKIKIDLIESVPALEQQIALKDWRTAYAAAEDCLKVSARAQKQLEQRNRSLMAKELQQSIHEYEKQGVLSIVPEQKEQIKDAFHTFKRPGEEETYGDVYQKFQDTTAEVEKLPDTVLTQTRQRTDEIASMLQQADIAGANKYYKEWYRELASDLQLLRNAIRGENLGEIAVYVRKLDREAPRLLAASQAAAAEDEYLSELEKNLNQMNNVFQDFGFLGSIPKRLLLASRMTEHKLDETQIDMYRALQGQMSVSTLRVNAALLEENVIGLNPPETMKKVHAKALKSFKNFRIAAEAFETYGESDAHDLYYREKTLSRGYDSLDKSLEINEELLYEITEARKLKGFDKFMRGIKKIESKVSNFYYNYGYK